MRKEAQSENRKETSPDLDVLDMGDAIEETKQTAPVPRYPDSGMGGWGVHWGS
jgi:hypothetical protein